MTTRNTVNVIEGTVTVVEVITAGPQGALGGGGGAGTDLSWDAATRTVASSTGADAVITEATTALPGLMSAADKALVNRAATVTVAVRNNSGVAIPKGAAVYVVNTSGTTITVALADASLEATAAQTLGLAQDAISNNSNGTVIAVGELTGLDTSGLTEGAIIWLSETTGALTTTRPTQPAHGVVLGYCVKQGPGTSGIVYVKVDNGQELDELHDVLVTGATTDQALMKAADGLWKNKTITPALIGAATAAQGALADSAVQPATLSSYLTTAAAATTYQPLGAVTSVTATGLLTSSGGTTPQISTSIATNSLAGRFTAGTGALEAITIGSGLAISGGALVVTAGGTGTVTSVGLSLPSIFSVTGSPVTTSGTLAATLATQAANLVFAGPSSGAAAAPTFRQLGYSELSGTPALSAVATSGAYADLTGKPSIPAAADAAPQPLGAAAAIGTSPDYAREDHVHARPSAADIGAAASGAIGSSGLTMATARLLGRTTASTGAPEEITVGSGLSLSAGTLTATGGGGGAANYQEFTSSGTWTKPAGCTYYYAEVVGGGGGGGGGRSAATTFARAGGGGGAGGTLTYRWGRISDFGTAESIPITIGAGGTGGIGTTNSNGGSGAAGGTSSFGSVLSAIGGGGGTGGTSSTGAGGTIRFRGNAAFGAGFAGAGGAGGRGDTSAAAGLGSIGAYGPGGGGGGGGITVNDTAVIASADGGAGFAQNVANATMANATTGGGSTLPGDGGAGGAASTTGAGTSGSVGVVPGGGGGGGGASSSTVAAGNGGNGAAGIVRIWCW